MQKVSIIIPIYNTKNEIVKCLNSVVNQTYKNLEIICIDDGSSDGSEQIVDDFAEQDNRIKVIHKANGGESSARNVGLKISTGQYIAFCDCDDWLEEEMFEILVSTMEKENVDMVASSWYKDFLGDSQRIVNELPVSDKVFGRDELLKYLYMRDSYRGFAYMWNKLYKREITNDIQGNQILFDETLRVGGDIVYLAEIALNVTKIKYIDRAFYHYVQREESSSHTKDIKVFCDTIKAYEILIKKFSEEHIDYEIIDYIKRFLAYHSSNIAEMAINQKEIEAKKALQKIMRKYEKEYIRLNIQYPERIKRYKNILSQ